MDPAFISDPALDLPTDEPAIALIRRAAAGDAQAFGRFYGAWAGFVAGFAYRLLGRDTELEDIVQETFVEAARNLSKLREPAALRGWLRTIVVRRVNRRLAERYRRKEIEQAMLEQGPCARKARDQDGLDTLYRALAHLPPKLRVPWILHRIEGETVAEVARICEIGSMTVKRRVRDADHRLRKRLQ